MNGRDETLVAVVCGEKRVVRKELRKTVVAAERKKRHIKKQASGRLDINQGSTGRWRSATAESTRAGRGGADLETLAFVHSRWDEPTLFAMHADPRYDATVVGRPASVCHCFPPDP